MTTTRNSSGSGVVSSDARPAASRSSRTWRWTILVPVLTLGVFALLCLASFVEISRREPTRALSVEEVSAEVLARYASESRRLGEIRSKARAGLDAEHFLALFAPESAESRREPREPGATKDDGAEARREHPLPSRAMVLADLQAMSASSPREIERLCHALVPLWRTKLANDATPAEEHELLAALFRQCAVSVGNKLEIRCEDRPAIFALAGELLDKRPEAAASVVFLLRHAVGPEDLGSLEELRRKVEHHPQLSREVDRLVAVLKSGGGADSAAGI